MIPFWVKKEMNERVSSDHSSFRRRFVVLTMVGLSFVSAAGERQPLKPGEQPPKPWLVINEDNDRYFIAADRPGRIEKTTAEGCERYLDTVLDGGKVTHFFMCVCGQRASFGSKAWEPIWKGLEGGVEKDGVTPATNNAWCLNAKLMHDKGVDPYAIWTRRCRERGVSPWISMRMNDNHYCNITNYFRNENFWRFHPELRLKRPANKPNWTYNFLYNNLDYAEEAVRAHAYAMVDEILDRWDADGIEIDWMRCPHNLSPSKEVEQAGVLTEFMRGVRRRADEAARRRGHPVRVAARIPPVFTMAKTLGYDAESWAQDGSVDIIILCNAYASAEFNFDLEDWKARIRRRNPSVTVLPGTDSCVSCCYPAQLLMSDEFAAFRRGWCVAHANPDGFYFFNMPYQVEAVKAEVYSRSLLPERLETLPRRFAVSFHDINYAGHVFERQLPASVGKEIILHTRAAPGRFDTVAHVVAGFDAADAAAPSSVTLNGAAPVGEPERMADASRCGPLAKAAFRWTFPVSALRKGENRMTFAAVPGGSAKMVWCDIELPAPETKGL